MGLGLRREKRITHLWRYLRQVAQRVLDAFRVQRAEEVYVEHCLERRLRRVRLRARTHSMQHTTCKLQHEEPNPWLQCIAVPCRASSAKPCCEGDFLTVAIPCLTGSVSATNTHMRCGGFRCTIGS
jgi:hypothetical protein